MKPIALSSLPPHLQSQVVGALHGEPAKAVPLPVEKPRLRQDTKGPNKTELAFKEHLQGSYRVFYMQAVTLLLANGVRYTPDFFVPNEGICTKPVFFEVKGFMREDASVKIKVAARLHPWAEFNLVTKRTKKQGGGWHIERVLP